MIDTLHSTTRRFNRNIGYGLAFCGEMGLGMEKKRGGKKPPFLRWVRVRARPYYYYDDDDDEYYYYDDDYYYYYYCYY